MAYYEDLSPYQYAGPLEPLEPRPVNVGWLSREIPFPKGKTSKKFKEKLQKFCDKDFIVLRMFGFHECEFCDPSKPRHGNGEIRVRGKSAVYAAPALIHHYVVEHKYKPPKEFIDAVLAGEPDSDEQRALLSKYQ